MSSSEIGAPDVLHGYGQILAQKPSSTCDESQLPYSKGVIKETLAQYLMQCADDRTARQLELAYLLLADFQQLSDDERRSVEVMENLEDTSDITDRELQELASRVADSGAVYLALRNRICEESRQLQQELHHLRD